LDAQELWALEGQLKLSARWVLIFLSMGMETEKQVSVYF
jgi:hypothetical protein